MPWMRQAKGFNFFWNNINKESIFGELVSFEPLSVHINRKTKEKPIAFPHKQFQNKKVI